MNDFTKEELNSVAIGIALLIGKSSLLGTITEDLINLVSKIDSLIDNYCEHEMEVDIHHSDIEICIKCGRREWWGI